MSFTYDLSLPGGQVRFHIGDTDALQPQLQDDEIDFLVAQRGGNVLAASVDACYRLARQYARTPNFTADGLQFFGSTRAQLYLDLAKSLAKQVTGGLSVAKLVRNDGYALAATASEYASPTVVGWENIDVVEE